MGNCCATFDTGSDSEKRVTSFVFYSQEFLDSLHFGDLIELNRGAFSHWAMYFEKGMVVHLKIWEGRDLDTVSKPEGFVPATVKCHHLKDLSGISLIRVNNKPEYRRQAPLRPKVDVLRIIELLLAKQERVYSYCLLYFNCEHFVTFLKFEGISKSDQILSWNSRYHFLSFIQKAERRWNDVGIFNTLAYLQWLDNVNAACDDKEPREILERSIMGIDRSRQVLRENVRRKFSMETIRTKVNLKGTMETIKKSLGGDPILFNTEFGQPKISNSGPPPSEFSYCMSAALS